MNRRGFLQGLGSLVGGILLEKAIPLGRVWSFPSEIKCLNVEPIITPSVGLTHLAAVYYDKVALMRLEQMLPFVKAEQFKPLPQSLRKPISLYRFQAS